MFNNLNQIFTIPNEDLTKDGSVDVMGFQMIWTYYGQQIFGNKLTTVSFDIRNYTINLFHYYLISSLDRKIFNEAVNRYSGYKTEYDFRAGLLIFLEDLLVYSLLKRRDEIDTGIVGLLGSANGQRNLDNVEKTIYLEANKDKGILVRQIQLGINGRYKGPFMSMHLVDRQLNSTGNWQEISEIFQNWKPCKKLIEVLNVLLIRLLKSNDKDFPKQKLENLIDDKLLDAYVSSFGIFKPNEALSDFWIRNLGINEGAAASIYKELKHENEYTESKKIIELARDRTLNVIEREKLNKILKVEPLLSQCSYVFYLLTNPSYNSIDEILDKVERICKEVNLFDVEPLIKENERLRLLYSYLSKAQRSNGLDPNEFIKQIVAYHEDIMQTRNGGIWVEIKGNSIKHLYSFIDKVRIEDVLNNSFWYHNYYLGSLRAILNGLNVEEHEGV